MAVRKGARRAEGSARWQKGPAANRWAFVFQVACVGLINAIDRFSLEREVAFSSYAVPTILGEIKRYFRDRTWSVRVPRDLQDLALADAGRLRMHPETTDVADLLARLVASHQAAAESAGVAMTLAPVTAVAWLG